MKVEDFNTASAETLLGLPGFGKKTVERIIAYRSKYQFKTANDLLKIKGIGINTLTSIGIQPPEKKKKKSKSAVISELTQYISNFTLTRRTPFSEYSHNAKTAFYEDLVTNTCQRPDIVRSSTGCVSCPYALLCKCHLRNFISDRSRKRTSQPSKKTISILIDNIERYYHYKKSTGEPNTEKVNL